MKKKEAQPGRLGCASFFFIVRRRENDEKSSAYPSFSHRRRPKAKTHPKTQALLGLPLGDNVCRRDQTNEQPSGSHVTGWLFAFK